VYIYIYTYTHFLIFPNFYHKACYRESIQNYNFLKIALNVIMKSMNTMNIKIDTCINKTHIEKCQYTFTYTPPPPKLNIDMKNDIVKFPY
jgi:hypothetical protein